MNDVTKGFYRHFKGEIYYVVGVVEDVTNVNQIGDEPTKMVLYHKMLTPNDLIVREITEFTATVHADGTDCLSFDDRCDGTSSPRYTRMEERSQQAEMRVRLLEAAAGDLIEQRLRDGIMTPDEIRKFMRLGFDGPDDA